LLDPAATAIARDIFVFMVGSPKMVIVRWVINNNQLRTGGAK
jgi:hypothetical protein